MKKWSLLLSLVVLLSFAGNTQVEHLYSYKDDKADIIRANKNLVFTFSMVSKSWTEKEFVFYDLKGKELNRMKFDLEKGYTLRSHKAIGTHTVMCFSQKDKMQLLVIDKDGKEFARKVIEEVKVSSAQIQAIDDTHFVLMHQEKVKKVGKGVVATSYDLGLKSSWSHREFAEKGNNFLILSASNEFQESVVLYQFKYGDYFLMFLNKEGKVISNKKIDRTDLKNYDPYKLFFKGTEALVIANLGNVDEGTFASMPEGLNVMKINNQGSKMNSSSLNLDRFKKWWEIRMLRESQFLVK